MKKRRILIIAAAAACAVTLVVVGVIRGYFTEVEVKENKITIGNISINLTEGSFDPETTYPVVPGSVVEKAPKIANDGNRDEFVLMTVTVPKAQVTLLDESGSNKGNPKTGLDSIQQLFRLVAEQTDPNTVLQVPTISGRDIDFTYHSGSDSAAGISILPTIPAQIPVKALTAGCCSQAIPQAATTTSMCSATTRKCFPQTRPSPCLTRFS